MAPTRYRSTGTLSARVRVDAPISAADTCVARLLDRTGKALPLPVSASVTVEDNGTRWMSARLTLAP